MNSTCDMFIHKLSLMLSSSNLLVICIIIFNICNLHCMNLEWAEFLFSICAAYVNCNSHCLTFKSFSQSVISFAWFSALMLSSFIDVSLCSVDAAHMLSRDLSDQIWIILWSCLMILTYASHRLRSFSNPTSNLECAGHMLSFKFNPTSRNFSDPGSTFPTPRRAAPPLR